MLLLSVIMPVYNAEKYLGAAIDSILGQTFRDFEFIIINDGSSDRSEEIILSCGDPRIVYVKNPVNLGLVGTLNKAVELARGKYTARMDHDDIADVRRFEIQLERLKNDPLAKMICSPVIGITAGGKLRDHWPADYNSRTSDQIYRTLPDENCIAHPTILIETEVLKKYRYSEDQKGSEDWDLWLRLARDGVKIIKTDEVLLQYRVHESSITLQFNAVQSAQLKTMKVRWRFFMASLAAFRLNVFVLRTFLFIFRDLGYHLKVRTVPRLMKKIKWLLSVNPLKALAEARALKSALRDHHSRYFFFFPYSHIGGAEKVHGQIVRLMEDQQPFVLITGLSDRSGNLRQFGTDAKVLRAARALYHPFFGSRAAKLVIQKINSTPGAIVFGANNLFFEEMILRIRPGIFVADLTHDISYGKDRKLPAHYLSSIMRCDARVFISNLAIEKTMKFYDENFIDDQYKSHIRLIYNYVEPPMVLTPKTWQQPFKALYVGRDTPEKAVGRIFELAARCIENNMPVEFVMVGEIKKRQNPGNMSFRGIVTDPHELSAIYNQAHFIVISSLSEGFPLSLMEGMIHGCIPLATAVGDIPFHIKNGFNGFLVPSGNTVPEDLFATLKDICENRHDLQQVSGQSTGYARSTFSKEKFVSAYLTLFRRSAAPPHS